MKLIEITDIQQQLDERIVFDFVRLYNTYGSWMHPLQSEPVYVENEQGHSDMAQKILGQQSYGQSSYQQMFAAGWVRAVHDKMNFFTLSSTAENLTAIFPKIVTLRQAVNKIYLDVEKCSEEKGCETAKTGMFMMPQEWNKLRQAITS